MRRSSLHTEELLVLASQARGWKEEAERSSRKQMKQKLGGGCASSFYSLLPFCLSFPFMWYFVGCVIEVVGWLAG